MRKIRLAVVIAAALGLNVTGATLWFRPVDGYGWNSPANWLTGAGTAVNRLPQTDDAVLLGPAASKRTHRWSCRAVSRRSVSG